MRNLRLGSVPNSDDFKDAWTADHQQQNIFTGGNDHQQSGGSNDMGYSRSWDGSMTHNDEMVSVDWGIFLYLLSIYLCSISLIFSLILPFQIYQLHLIHSYSTISELTTKSSKWRYRHEFQFKRSLSFSSKTC